MGVLLSPKDWEELNKLLWKKSWNPKKEKINPYVAFRGLSENYDNLKTSIQRIGSFSESELATRERRLIDNFRIYASEHCTLGSSDWDVYMIAQHYGLPTRLLDWTSNPYVALFHATQNSDKLCKDGEIWYVLRDKTNATLPPPFDALLKGQQGYNLFYLETLKNKFKKLEQFDKQSKEALIWFEPPSSNSRFVNQYAFFSVMPGIATSTSEWLKRHSGCYFIVRIPASLKHEIRERLKIMNISHRTMYPGLSGVAKWLKEFYSN